MCRNESARKSHFRCSAHHWRLVTSWSTYWHAARLQLNKQKLCFFYMYIYSYKKILILLLKHNESFAGLYGYFQNSIVWFEILIFWRILLQKMVNDKTIWKLTRISFAFQPLRGSKFPRLMWTVWSFGTKKSSDSRSQW